LRYHFYMKDTPEKIVRTLCRFEEKINASTEKQLLRDQDRLLKAGFEVQTMRICSSGTSLREAADISMDPAVFIGAGKVSRDEAGRDLDFFFRADNVSFHIEPEKQIRENDVDILFRMIRDKPEKTFNFAFAFNNVNSSPYFPSARFHTPGQSLGLQPTDLAESCHSEEEWFSRTEKVWQEICKIFPGEEFLGIDSSIAPLYSGKSSLIHHIKRWQGALNTAVTSNIFLKISRFIDNRNPRPAGLCGIMFPCLEDFELADEYEAGNFPVERNIFLSLHSGLGIDTYPIGIDESPARVLQVLTLLQGLSDKYKKPLAARFISDGRSKIGEKSEFNNKYLKDVVLRKL